jgi:hypothetical protein
MLTTPDFPLGKYYTPHEEIPKGFRNFFTRRVTDLSDHPTDANPKGLKKLLTFDSACGLKDGLSTAIRHQLNRRLT